MDLICEFNFDDSTESKKNNLSRYAGKQGVWALIGKDKRVVEGEQEDKWSCLQVGQTQDIKEEIEKDIKDMEESRKGIIERRKGIIEREYVNYFGEAIFSYPETYSGNSCLYKWIVDNYRDLKFILIKEENNKNNRKKIEKFFAYITLAKGWRNGGSFREECCWVGRYDFVKKDREKLEDELSGILLENEIKEIKSIEKQFLTLDNTKYHNYFKDILSEYSD